MHRKKAQTADHRDFFSHVLLAAASEVIGINGIDDWKLLLLSFTVTLPCRIF